MAPATLTELVGEYMLAAGVGKSGACHLFRHTMATLMLEGGADVRFIQEMLGHANPQTTQIYTRVSIQKLKAIHDATHPGAKLRPAAARAPDDKTEADRAALLQALAADQEQD
jgi:integrase/recombinase XerD